MIREAKLEDIEKIENMEKKIFPSSFYSINSLKEMMGNKNYYIYMYIDEKEILGYIILHDSIDVIEIMKIATKKDSRNTGIGKKLLEKTKEVFEQNIFLEVRESNEIAQNFYKNFGFTQVGRRKNYYGDTGEAAILMVYDRQ
ncbi:MAG: ribosomal protein S18-alanine N-acetyltransferase [Cetobacterium sp.]|nr:ribosomal protein S18-alanine N-acetyltransferase [Cetobacterium sp.]